MGEGQIAQNRPMICNSPNVSRVKPFFVRLNSIPYIVQTNVVHIRLFKELTPSLRMPKMMNGIPQMLIIVLERQYLDI